MLIFFYMGFCQGQLWQRKGQSNGSQDHRQTEKNQRTTLRWRLQRMQLWPHWNQGSDRQQVFAQGRKKEG